MDEDKFEGYITKVLNLNETNALKEFLIFGGYVVNVINALKNFQMMYIPNVEIIEKILNRDKLVIYYLSDHKHTYWNLQKKLSLQTLLNKDYSIVKIILNKYGKNYNITKFDYTEIDVNKYTDTHKYMCNHIYDVVKYRLQNTFMLLNYIFITDIAKYLFLIYYEVAFG